MVASNLMVLVIQAMEFFVSELVHEKGELCERSEQSELCRMKHFDGDHQCGANANRSF
jgi:hypothetical protein